MNDTNAIETQVTEELITSEQKPNAVRLFEIAIALGAEVPAPVGSFCYALEVEVNDPEDARDDYRDIIGLYQSETSANAGLVNWILEQWQNSMTAPWIEDYDDMPEEEYKEEEKLYLDPYTDKEIIEEFFSNDLNRYSVHEMKIQENPPKRIVVKKTIEVKSSFN